MVPVYVLLALTVSLLYSLIVLADKTYTVSRFPNVYVLTFLTDIIMFAVFSPLILTDIVTVPSLDTAVMAVSIGPLFLIPNLLYFEAMKRGAPATVVTVQNLKPLFVAVLAVGIVGEVLSPVQYVGIAVMIGAVALLSVTREDGSVQLSAAAVFAAGSALSFAFAETLMKTVVMTINPVTTFYLAKLGAFVVASILLVGWFWDADDFQQVRAAPLDAGVGVLIVRSGAIAAATLLLFMAAQRGPIAVVSTLTSTEVLFVVVVTTVAARWSSWLSPEDIQQSSIWVKLASGIGIMVGVFLI